MIRDRDEAAWDEGGEAYTEAEQQITDTGRAYGAGFAEGLNKGKEPHSFDLRAYDAGFKEGFKKGKGCAPFEFDDEWKEAYYKGFEEGKEVGIDVGMMIEMKPVQLRQPPGVPVAFRGRQELHMGSIDQGVGATGLGIHLDARPDHRLDEKSSGEPMHKKLKSSED